jgi:hypothetical protein
VTGRWYLEGATFRTIPDPPDPNERIPPNTTWPVDWSEEIENLQSSFVEYDGKLYKRCNFFNNVLHESTLPFGYWGY